MSERELEFERERGDCLARQIGSLHAQMAMDHERAERESTKLWILENRYDNLIQLIADCGDEVMDAIYCTSCCDGDFRVAPDKGCAACEAAEDEDY